MPPPTPTHPPRRREWLLRLALLGFSTAVALLAAELAVRIAGLGAPPPAPPNEVGHSFFAYHPTLGWELVPGAYERETSAEFDVEVRIDAAGLRNHAEVPVERVPGRRRILTLGDSFTFGHGVEVAQAWPARLAAALPATEVVNLAVTGTGTDQQLLRFEQRGLAWQPDRVLLGLFVGDVFRNHRTEYFGYPKPRFVLDEEDRLELANVPVPRQLPSRSEPSVLLGLLTRRGGDLAEHLGFGEAWPVTAAILTRLKERCRESGAELGVVVIPKDQMIYGSGLRRWVNERAQTRVLGLLDSQGIPRLDLTPALAARAAERPEERLYFPIDGHWTAAGHAAAAEAVAAWVREGPR